MTRVQSKKHWPETAEQPQARIQRKYKTRQSSKADTLIALLKRKKGVSIPEMMHATGWQSHSIRGFMAGTLKKKFGHTASSTKSKSGERRYHVASN